MSMTKRKLMVLAAGLFVFLLLFNVQFAVRDEASQDISLLGVGVTTSMPSAVACIEIYCWGCQVDICYNRPHGSCCIDNIYGYWRYMDWCRN